LSQSIRRFWKEVSLVPVDVPQGYEVCLDGRSFRLPGGNRLILGTLALAEAVAEEWRSIPPGSAFQTTSLPLTQMAGTQIERVAPDRAQIIGQLMAYGESDLLCYRATGSLGREQDALFDPVLQRFAARHGIMPEVTRSLLPLTVAPELQEVCRKALERFDDSALTCAAIGAPATGSLILAIGLAEGWMQAKEASDMASVEERHQMAQWGEDDALLQEIERTGIDIDHALHFLALSQEKAPNGA